MSDNITTRVISNRIPNSRYAYKGLFHLAALAIFGLFLIFNKGLYGTGLSLIAIGSTPYLYIFIRWKPHVFNRVSINHAKKLWQLYALLVSTCAAYLAIVHLDTYAKYFSFLLPGFPLFLIAKRALSNTLIDVTLEVKKLPVRYDRSIEILVTSNKLHHLKPRFPLHLSLHHLHENRVEKVIYLTEFTVKRSKITETRSLISCRIPKGKFGHTDQESRHSLTKWFVLVARPYGPIKLKKEVEVVI